MAKKLVICPDCGHQFPANFQGVHGQTAGVRWTRTTEGQFQTAIDVPGEMVEHQRYFTMLDQLLAAGAVGVSAGTLAGYFASIPWHVSEPGIAAEIIISSALAGLVIGWSCLAKERAWQLTKALPMAVSQYLALAKAKIPSPDGVTLTIDTRNEYDGFTSRYFGPLPVEVERFNRWASAAIAGDSLAINKWSGGGKEFDRYTEYEPLVKMMLNAGVLAKTGKGNILTHTGKRTLRQHLKAHSPTTPQECA